MTPPNAQQRENLHRPAANIYDLPDHEVTLPETITPVTSNTVPDLTDVPWTVRVILRICAFIRWGSLLVILPDDRGLLFQGRDPGEEAVIKINNYGFATKLWRGGTIGFAESYLDGHWESPNVTALLEVLARNDQELARFYDMGKLFRPVQRLFHALNRNTKSGSRRNIMAHYDLGNDFYGQWLDDTMTYSSAKFADTSQDLSAAQLNKYKSLAERIDLQPGHSLLEIGSGWGGFAEYAAGHIGCQVTGITISPEQLKYSTKRIKTKGLSDQVSFQLTDYRDVTGQFDRIVSIEMFEAVGAQYWSTYFDKVRDRLKPGGIAGLQTITIADQYFDQYRAKADFIQKYIFPGGMLPSPSVLKTHVTKAGLTWKDNVTFGQDYAATLNLWRHRFQSAWPNLQDMGFDEKFRLLWKYYLSYCEAGFRSGAIDVTQVSLQKP